MENEEEKMAIKSVYVLELSNVICFMFFNFVKMLGIGGEVVRAWCR
jgi:hypothetical protein